jgi:hypothetical protein
MDVGFVLRIDAGGNQEDATITGVTDGTHVKVQNLRNGHSAGATAVILSQRDSLLSNWNLWLSSIRQQVWGGPTMPGSNYFWGNVHGEFLWAIATYDDQPDFASNSSATAEAFLDDALNTRWTNAFINNAALFYGGHPPEGDSYGTAMAQGPIIMFETAKNLGRDLVNESAFYRNQLMYWMLYWMTPASTFDKDAGISTFHPSPVNEDEHYDEGGILWIRNYFEDYMGWYAAYAASNYSSTNIGKYARQWFNGLLPKAPKNVNPNNTSSHDYYFSNFLMASDPGNTPEAYASLPLDTYASGYQLGVMQNAWDTTSPRLMWLASTGAGGIDDAHFHKGEIGSFNLWKSGRWISRESVGYIKTVTGPSEICTGAGQDTSAQPAHNVLAFTNVVLGRGSCPPHPPEVRGFSMLPTAPKASPTVLRLETQTSYGYVAMDNTAVYKWNDATLDTGVVGQVIRELLWVRPLSSFVVFDRVLTQDQTSGGSLTAAQVVTAQFTHFETDPTREDAQHYTSTNNLQVGRLTILVPASAIDAVVVDENKWCLEPEHSGESECRQSLIGQYRVEVPNAGAAQRYHLSVIQARATTEANVTASVVDSNSGDPTSGTFTVTLHPSAGSDTTIVFNKGATSSGGTINVAGAGAVSLRSNVEPMSITDSGPVWGP